jgi:hypothetical protein
VVGDVDVPSNEWSDLVAAWNRVQKPPLALRRQPVQLTRAVACNLGAREGTERDVGGDNLPVVTTGLIEEHGQAVRFLAVATSGAPHGMRRTARFAHELGEGRELSGVPEEGAVLNGDSIQEIVECSGLAFEHVDVSGHCNPRDVRALREQSLEPGTA